MSSWRTICASFAPGPNRGLATIPRPSPVTTPPAAPPAPAPEPVVAVADEAVATPEDFEDEAFSKVSDKTYKAELETLKKAIEAK